MNARGRRRRSLSWGGVDDLFAAEVSALFCTDFLEPSLLDFIVISDTHYMKVPDGSRLEFANHAKQGARTGAVLGLAASLREALGAAFVLHLGDKCQAYAGTEAFRRTMAEAVAQMKGAGLADMHHVAGNQDMGDKPDPTMPTESIAQEKLDWYHANFGCSWYSFTHGQLAFVVLNSMLLNAPLADSATQMHWLEHELPRHQGKRIFLFLHIPLYLWDEREMSLGHYENIDEPARGRILNLIRAHEVEAVLSGHVHFSFFDHIGRARFMVLCSPSFTRTGFPYLFPSAPPPMRGRDDTPKMGFYLFRVFPERHDIHFIRTQGAEALPDPSTQYLLTRVSSGYDDSPLGITFRGPLTPFAEIPISWPASVREKVRNDYPLMLSLEMGVKHARLPASDWLDPFHRRRIGILRKEGVAATAMLLWPNRQALDDLLSWRGDFDQLEIQNTGAVVPDAAFLDDLKKIRQRYRGPLALSVIQSRIRISGKGFPQHRLGYLPDELEALNQALAAADIAVDRVLCRLPFGEPAWEFVRSVPEAMSHIRNVDFIAELRSTDDVVNATHAAESFLSVRLRGFSGRSRVFFDPLNDMDRSMDDIHGLLDTLCNPRPVFHVLRALNTVLAGFDRRLETELQVADQVRIIAAHSGKRWCKVVLPATVAPAPRLNPASISCGEKCRYIDLSSGTVRTGTAEISVFGPLLFYGIEPEENER